MNIPEFAKIVRVSKNNTTTILGEHFDTNIVLYSILNVFGISGDKYSIIIDSSKASNGVIRYKIKPLNDNEDLTYIKDSYNNSILSLFGKTFISTTKILNDTLIITIYEK